ncbi:2Fe-2S iron-sulfur cluster-binding protein [Sediminicoccus sp. KRV36]|uniref:xanthine dehydrogenase family Fe-S subunit n=1 Tax=Sediminicoccus sp. KRV36 TaxID=3133721 RepID=UPI00200F7C73|nr:2Fe-2S iron-sulfur cluster-binding protein [Sediminicoccus rosea]UPY35708.1 2Fe-2S iron-sulfur cluster binding domain-containing protein [Sediminicoccus rosea]
MITLHVNGARREVSAPARTHLADVIREHCGLTGTHLGCEQGVCGACTVLVNGAPTRSCLIYAHEAAGMEVTTIEGLDEDPVAEALRAAFNRHHALQCGYCTPGMMMTARDIVIRLGAVDETRIRDELAGNLCRCTGYRGIVRAIAEVAATRPAALPLARREAAIPAPPPPPLAVNAPPVDAALPNHLEHRETLAIPPDVAWLILSDPARIADCVPGMRLIRHEGTLVEGEMAVSLGPFAVRFAGLGTLTLDQAARMGRLRGQGRDGANGAEGEVQWRLEPDGEASRLLLELGWRLTGPLAQFSRPALLRGVVAAMAADFARNLERQARGEAVVAKASFWGLLLGWWRALIRR